MCNVYVVYATYMYTTPLNRIITLYYVGIHTHNSEQGRDALFIAN